MGKRKQRDNPWPRDNRNWDARHNGTYQRNSNNYNPRSIERSPDGPPQKKARANLRFRGGFYLYPQPEKRAKEEFWESFKNRLLQQIFNRDRLFISVRSRLLKDEYARRFGLPLQWKCFQYKVPGLKWSRAPTLLFWLKNNVVPALKKKYQLVLELRQLPSGDAYLFYNEYDLRRVSRQWDKAVRDGVPPSKEQLLKMIGRLVGENTLTPLDDLMVMLTMVYGSLPMDRTGLVEWMESCDEIELIDEDRGYVLYHGAEEEDAEEVYAKELSKDILQLLSVYAYILLEDIPRIYKRTYQYALRWKPLYRTCQTFAEFFKDYLADQNLKVVTYSLRQRWACALSQQTEWLDLKECMRKKYDARHKIELFALQVLDMVPPGTRLVEGTFKKMFEDLYKRELHMEGVIGAGRNPTLEEYIKYVTERYEDMDFYDSDEFGRKERFWLDCSASRVVHYVDDEDADDLAVELDVIERIPSADDAEIGDEAEFERTGHARVTSEDFSAPPPFEDDENMEKETPPLNIDETKLIKKWQDELAKVFFSAKFCFFDEETVEEEHRAWEFEPINLNAVSLFRGQSLSKLLDHLVESLDKWSIRSVDFSDAAGSKTKFYFSFAMYKKLHQLTRPLSQEKDRGNDEHWKVYTNKRDAFHQLVKPGSVVDSETLRQMLEFVKRRHQVPERYSFWFLANHRDTGCCTCVQAADTDDANMLVIVNDSKPRRPGVSCVPYDPNNKTRFGEPAKAHHNHPHPASSAIKQRPRQSSVQLHGCYCHPAQAPDGLIRADGHRTHRPTSLATRDQHPSRAAVNSERFPSNEPDGQDFGGDDFVQDSYHEEDHHGGTEEQHQPAIDLEEERLAMEEQRLAAEEQQRLAMEEQRRLMEEQRKRAIEAEKQRKIEAERQRAMREDEEMLQKMRCLFRMDPELEEMMDILALGSGCQGVGGSAGAFSWVDLVKEGLRC
ncbi:hypothetical protein HK102_010617 [Quaeritorhiza haematococci]|nr:hypothetical protein HK102_010617 [Quaeritorhiza haematococci]